MELEKTLLRKVGEAVARFKMIRDGDRVAVALSGGKDSATMLEALLLLQKRAPIDFSIRAFTVEQGKFLSSIQPVGEYLKQRGIDWTYFRDEPSLRLLEEQPGHGCDLCSRYRRRAVYEIARDLGANVIAFGPVSGQRRGAGNQDGQQQGPGEMGDHACFAFRSSRPSASASRLKRPASTSKVVPYSWVCPLRNVCE